MIVLELKSRGVNARFGADVGAIVDDLGITARDGDLIVIMSNGGFGSIHQRVLDRLQAAA